MTHLPVKLLPVETARPWHRTQCLCASHFKKIYEPIWYRSDSHWDYATLWCICLLPELKAPKQWAPNDQMRHRVDQAAFWEPAWRISMGSQHIYFWILWDVSNAGLALCETRGLQLFRSDSLLWYSAQLSPHNAGSNTLISTLWAWNYARNAPI